MGNKLLKVASASYWQGGDLNPCFVTAEPKLLVESLDITNGLGNCGTSIFF